MHPVSAIVLNYNGAHLLPGCLDSLLAQDYPFLEILVIDNASADESRAVVGRYPSVRWIPLPKNQGLGPGYNAGAAQARGRMFFFANNDTWFEPDCIRRLVEAFRDDLLAADPLQLDWNGQRVIHGAQRFRFGWHYALRPVPGMDPYQILDADVPMEIPWACAGAMLVDRRKFEALGGFDPTFFLDYEDLDLCWRGWLRGWKTLFVPAARLRHHVSESERGAPAISVRRALSQIKNAQRFTWKTMPASSVAASVAGTFFHTGSALLRGRFRQSGRQMSAFLWNCFELNAIGSERRKILGSSVTTSSALLQKRWSG